MLELKVSFKSSIYIQGLEGGSEMKIGELAGRSGLNASAIRYYERRGLLPAPHRAGGQRRYPADALHRVVLIRFASEMGFTLSEIKVFLNGLQDDAPVGPRWTRLAHRKILEVDQSIRRSRRLKSLLEHFLHCRCISLEVCVKRLTACGESQNFVFVT
jgi:redox-sensitive transcriptional activator SoxR